MPTDTYIQEFLVKVRLGLVDGASIVHKFGRNDAIPNGSFAKVCLLNDFNINNSSPTTVRVKAGGNAADTAAGAGARTLTIQGIDTSLAEVGETIALAGASASANSVNSYWRIHRMWVATAGTYGAANTAAITLEDSGGVGDWISIGAGEGQTQYAAYTIPDGKTGYVASVFVTVDSNKAADIKMMTRENMNDATAPLSSIRLKNYWDGITGAVPFKPVTFGGPIAEHTDTWVEAQGSGAVAEVSADFEILLIDD